MSEEELVKRRLGDGADWGEQVNLMIWIRRGRQAGKVSWSRGKSGMDYDYNTVNSTPVTIIPRDCLVLQKQFYPLYPTNV